MLQYAQLAARARASVSSFSRPWRSLDELERVADESITALRGAARGLARTRLERLDLWLDARVRTATREYFDRPTHPERRKRAAVRALHRQNVLFLSYRRFLDALSPVIEAAARAHPGRTVRALELASGAGYLTLALAERARRRGLDARFVGSDIVPAYVRDARERAIARRVPAHFCELDALRFADDAEARGVDVVFVVQSLHHFSPGQIARLIAQSRAVGARAFVAIDGLRSLHALAVLPLIALPSLDWYFVHDAFVSARRFYALPELEHLARLAAPGARVTVASQTPLMSMLTVDFSASDEALR